VKLLRELRAEGKGQDMAALLKRIPYARFLGIEVERKGNELTLVLPFQDHLIACRRPSTSPSTTCARDVPSPPTVAPSSPSTAAASPTSAPRPGRRTGPGSSPRPMVIFC